MLYTSHKTTGRANQMRITQSTNIKNCPNEIVQNFSTT